MRQVLVETSGGVRAQGKGFLGMGHKIAALHVVALFGWMIALTLVLVGMLTPHLTGNLGCLSAGVAMVLHFRAFLSELEERERNAFEVGRHIGADYSSEVHRLPRR